MRLVLFSNKLILLIIFPIFILLLLYPQEIISILLGAEYSPGHSSLMLLSSSQLIRALAAVLPLLLTMSGNQSYVVIVSFCGLLTNIFISIFLIPRYGIEGASIAFLVSSIVMTTLLLIFARRIFGTPSVISNWIAVATSGIPVLLLGMVSALLFRPSGFIEICVVFALILLIYGLLAWSLSLTKNERGHFVELIKDQLTSPKV